MKNIYLLTLVFLMNALWLKAQTPCPNLVINGDFEVPNASFAYGLPLSLSCANNTYAITTRFNLKCNNLPNFGDHTSGAGKFLVIGSSNTVATMWSTNVTVTPNTPYTFSFWASGAVGSFAPEPLSANLAMSVNGSNVPLSISVGNNPLWIQYTYSGTTPVGVTNLAIAINQITGGLGVSTYGIDDIVFAFCPSEPPCLSCPTGIASTNLVANGSFTNGNTGFTSGLTFSTGCATGNYGVATSFNAFCSLWTTTLTANSAPNFLILDGAFTAGPTVLWQTPVNLTAQTDYCFSFKWALAFADFRQNFPISIDIVTSGGVVVANANAHVGDETIANNLTWTNKTATWNSGTLTGPHFIAISQLSGSIYRDWGVDDICFTAKPPPCKANFTFDNLHTCGNVLFTNTSTSTTGLTYAWNFADAASGTNNTSTLQNPTHLFTTCGTYNVCLIIVGTECRDTICRTVTIVDNVPPVARCKPSVGVILDPTCQYNVTTAFVDNGSTDDCKIKSLAVSPTILTGCQNTNVTLTVTDWCNNVSTCTMGIQTIETVPPIITNCPTSQIVNTNQGQCYYTFPTPLVITATDNCDPTPSVSCTWIDPLGVTLPLTATTQFPKGINTIKCTAKDKCNNMSRECVFTLTVVDNQPPTITCPLSISVIGVLNVQGVCKAIVNNLAPTATDNCPMLAINWKLTGATLGQGIGDVSGTYFNQGITTVTYTASDMGGNSASCAFTIDVKCNPVIGTLVNDHLVPCGVSAEYFAKLGTGRTNRTPTTPVSGFPAASIMQCGKYNVYFEDYLTYQKGYWDPTVVGTSTLGQIRRNTLCAVLTYVQTVVNHNNVPASAPIRLYVQPSWSASNPASNSIPTVGYLAQAGPNYAATPSTKLINGFVFDYITSGSDPAQSNAYHGELTTNFDQTYSATSTAGTPIAWQNDHTLPYSAMANCNYDLYSVLLHEVGHIMGWLSFIEEASGTNIPQSSVGANYFSGLDYTYYKGATPSALSAATKLLTGGPSAPQINAAYAVGNSMINNDIWSSLNTGIKNDPVYSGLLMSFWPGSFARKSILSHLDDQMWLYSTRARIAPGDVQDYVMGPFGVQGIWRRTFTDAEINKFLVFGTQGVGLPNYTLNASFAGTSNLVNFPPYSSKMAGYNTIFNNDFPEAIAPDFTLVNSPSVNTKVIVLDNDTQISDLNGDHISIYPGSLTNIRGCGNGGNNHNQLTVTGTAATGQTITYTPRPNFFGRAQFGFKLWDGKEIGSYHIYTIDVVKGTNNVCAAGSNLILNGDLEEGTEVKQSGANEGIDAAVSEQSFLREGKIRQGIHFADAQPYCYISNNWGPYGAGEKIKNSYIYCSGSTYKSTAGSVCLSFPFGAFTAPNSQNGLGERFKNLAGGHNYFNLCDTVQPCKRYVLEFDYYACNNIASGATIPLTVGFTNATAFPTLSTLTYSLVHNIVTTPTTWQRVSIPLTYCGTTPATLLNLRQTAEFLGFLVDNLSLVEVIGTPPPLTVVITPATPSVSSTNQSVALTANVTNALCNVTYTWSGGITPTLQTNTVMPTATTNYSVVVNDGCRSTTANVTVTKLRDTCKCSPTAYFGLNYRPSQGGQTRLITCGDTLDAFCTPNFNWTLNGNFMCIGDTCPTIVPLIWTLTGPAPTQTGSTNITNTVFGLSIPSNAFNTVGTYTLVLAAVCGRDTCFCRFTIKAAGCPCLCGTFSNMAFSTGFTGVSAVCGNTTPQYISCPQSGQPLTFTGQFNCQGVTCPATSPVIWAVKDPLGGTIASSGTLPLQANPNFNLSFPQSLFSQAGTYSLILTGQCGATVCPPCTIKFRIFCPVMDTCQNACPATAAWQNLMNTPFIESMVMYQDRLIAAGHFGFSGNDKVAAWDNNIGWIPLGTGGPTGTVNTLAVYQNFLYVGGSFASPANNIAVWNGSTWISSFAGTNGVNGPVNSLLVYNNNLVVGGAFTTAGSISVNNLASWNGSAWTSAWSGAGNGITGTGTGSALTRVTGLGLYYGDLVVGGVFSTAGTTAARNIALWDGTTWSNLNAGIKLFPNNEVQGPKAIIQLGTELIVGGRFDYVENVLPVIGTQFIAKWHTLAGWSNMSTAPMNSFEGIYDFEIYGGELHAGGLFSTIGSTATTYGVARWNGSAWVSTNHPNRLVKALAVYKQVGKTCDLFSGGEVFFNHWGCPTGINDALLLRIHILPNPNTGIFTCELPIPATTTMTFRVTDITGRVLFDKQTEVGKLIQTVEAAALADGLYFLQVLSDGKVIGVEKFVKQ